MGSFQILNGTESLSVEANFNKIPNIIKMNKKFFLLFIVIKQYDPIRKVFVFQLYFW